MQEKQGGKELRTLMGRIFFDIDNTLARTRQFVNRREKNRGVFSDELSERRKLLHPKKGVDQKILSASFVG